jgi:hypothetical protein
MGIAEPVTAGINTGDGQFLSDRMGNSRPGGGLRHPGVEDMSRCSISVATARRLVFSGGSSSMEVRSRNKIQSVVRLSDHYNVWALRDLLH